ncbi:MAG: transcription termination factor Rho [Planctomycetota bacterium]
MAATDPGEDEQPRTTRRRTRRKKAEPVEAAAAATTGDDFGDGIDFIPEPDVPEPPEDLPKPKKRRTRTKAKKETESADAVAVAEPADEAPAEPSVEEGPVADEPVEQTAAASFGGDDAASYGGNGEDVDDRPRRRRRRRRGGGGEGGPNGQQPFQKGGRQGRGPNPQRRQQRGSSYGGPVNDEVTGTVEGVLELHPKGYGFLRDPSNDYAAKDSDPFVSTSLIERFQLREGVLVHGDVGPGNKGQGPRLKAIDQIEGRTPEEYAELKTFDQLTPINPYEQIKLERGESPVTMRVMDLLTPIGKGQRALIVAPPRTGKTMLIQDIAESVSINHPEVYLVVLLIDERPEEVTEMRRAVNGEVVASSLDRDVENHVRVSQLVVERCKRLAESGKHVFVLLDSITRLARAFNKYVSNSGRTGTGGLDIRALDIPKKLFGTARRFEEGGSVTVVGTALIETGAHMDTAIFQEFKGTGNMEMVLSRDLADRRIWPAMDIAQSGTRREEKLMSPETLDGVTLLRRSLVSLSPVQAMEDLTRTLRRFPTNEEFLQRVSKIL